MLKWRTLNTVSHFMCRLRLSKEQVAQAEQVQANATGNHTGRGGVRTGRQ